MSCEEFFLQQLRERGFRLTPQREIILSVLHDLEGLATAEEIYARVQAQSAAIDISTVYRTLELLQEFHMLTAIDLGDGQRRYELLGVHGEHSHMQCQTCGKLVGVEAGELQALADHLQAAYGFTLDVAHLTLPGQCQACRGE